MIHLRAGHSAALVPGGKVLIAEGVDSNGALSPIAELFDPATQTFSATGDLVQARTHATAILLPGGKVLSTQVVLKLKDTQDRKRTQT
jgi:hypothetical protein